MNARAIKRRANIARLKMTRTGRTSLLRSQAYAVLRMRNAEHRIIHGDADGHIVCGLIGRTFQAMAAQAIPAKLVGNPDWFHQHVTMPAARTYAKAEDQER